MEECELLQLVGRADELGRPSRWAWRPPFARVPPSKRALAACGFDGCMWAPGLAHDAPNLLLLLHGLGDAPSAFASFAAKLALPETSALALNAPLPLPHALPGRMWCESFERDGSLIDGTRRGEMRRQTSLERETRVRLASLLRLLTSSCGWPRERIFLFGFAQGGGAALDVISHLPLADGRLGGVVSWCGLPLPELIARREESNAQQQRQQQRQRPAAASTPLLVVAGGAADAETAPSVARELYDRLVATWQQPSRDADAAALPPQDSQALHLLEAHRGNRMVGSPSEARLLMEFFSRNLALSSALEDDPSIVRVA